MGQATAKLNITDLKKVLGLTDSSPEDASKSLEASEHSQTPSLTTPESASAPQVSKERKTDNSAVTSVSETSQLQQNQSRGSGRVYRVRRESMEQLNLIKVS